MHQGEFVLAKIKHQTWRLRLRSYLMGSNGVREAELTSPRECALGKWIYADALPKYGAHPEMQRLELDHIRIHELAGKMVRLRKPGLSDNLIQDFPDFQEFQLLSDGIISSLCQMETKIDSAKL
jgi:methyl-accepting chemotaxis protein